MPLEVDDDFSETALDDDGVVAHNFGLLFRVYIVEDGVGVGDGIGDGIVDSPGDVVERVDFFT